MKKKIISLIVIIALVLMPSILLADGIKTIIIVVDEISLNTVENLFKDNFSIGLVNLKTRELYSEENLYLSINKGKKLSKKDYEREKDKELLGDILKVEKTSYIGVGKEDIVLWDSDKKIDYEERSILYDIDWLVNKTDSMLEKSNVLLLGYNFNHSIDRIDTLNKYLDNYKEIQIIIFAKDVSREDEKLLNKSLVPIIHIMDQKPGLLTSSSTKREGFVALEDISVQIKDTYDQFNKLDIGESFKIIEKKDSIKQINQIYKTTINLLNLTYIFHGMLYLSQVILGIWLLKYKKIHKNIFLLYIFSSTIVLISLILGLSKLNQNIYIYLSLIIILSYILAKKIVEKKEDLISMLIILTYLTIVFGMLFYPKMIYNSYIGFNNLIYGARYYGLNNGIMGVLLASSILSFFILNKKMKNLYWEKILGVLIFSLNMIVLSTKFGANTGGYITSIILFILMIYTIFFNKPSRCKKIVLFLLVGILLFTANMMIDNVSRDKSHAIEFFYRLKHNGLMELIYIVSFKAKELITLTIKPPFSLVLIFQGIILNKLRKKARYKEAKKEKKIIMYITLIGFVINDTGMIMLIYMINYFILYLISKEELVD